MIEDVIPRSAPCGRTIAPAGKVRCVRQLSFELSFGDITDGLQANHFCDVRHCVQPHHLWLGTQADNMHDMLEKGRDRKIGPKNPACGERNSSAKLTATQVAAIRASDKSQRVLALEYGVSQPTIGRIKSGKGWRHVTDKVAA